MRMVSSTLSPMVFVIAGLVLASAGCHNRSLQPTPRAIAPIAWTPVTPSGLPDASPYPSALPANPFDTRAVVGKHGDRSLEVAQAAQPMEGGGESPASAADSSAPAAEAPTSGEQPLLTTQPINSPPEPTALGEAATRSTDDSARKVGQPTASGLERPSEDAPAIAAPTLVRLSGEKAADPGSGESITPAPSTEAIEAVPDVSPIAMKMPAPVPMAIPIAEPNPDTAVSDPQPRSRSDGNATDSSPRLIETSEQPALSTLSTTPTTTTAPSSTLPVETRQPLSDTPRSPLKISTLKVCEEVHGFGEFEEIKDKPLRPGQTVVVYCELESLRYERTEAGFRARFQSRLELASSSRTREQPVWSESLDEAEDLSRSARRDVYVNFRVTLPETLDSGRHMLRLEVMDRLADSTAEMAIPIEMLASP